MTRSEKAIRVIMAVLALASVAWAAVPMARHMAGIVVLDAPAVIDLPVPHSEDPPDLAAILALAPFGRAAVQDQGPEAATITRPDLVLRGIFAAEQATSTALLDVAGVPGLYRERMQVTDRLEITRIASDRVELTDGDTAITLHFDEDVEVNAPEVIADAAVAPALLDRLQGGFVVAARYEKPGQPETTSEYIDYWRQRVRKNPQAVLDEIGLKPTDRGYLIAERHDAGVRLAGLRSGDLVRSVNGKPVGNPENDTRFYDEIAATGQARIEVERGGRILSFSFPLR
ncbi:type II secretion system protein N [Tateyamaria armeniaca]|uniref:Type II secretion system protein N n=1 Tax=Tateyamaria armeniaca TaxID=2518930 RepID=A0ABW8USR2_9RHOB